MQNDEKDFISVLYTIKVSKEMSHYLPVMVGSGDPNDMHATREIIISNRDGKVLSHIKILRLPTRKSEHQFSLEKAEIPEGTCYIGFLIRKYRDNSTNYFLEIEEGLEALTFLDASYTKLFTISSMTGSSAKYIDITIEGGEVTEGSVINIGPAPITLVEKLER